MIKLRLYIGKGKLKAEVVDIHKIIRNHFGTMKIDSIFKGLKIAKGIKAVEYLECSAKGRIGDNEVFDGAARAIHYPKLEKLKKIAF